MKAPTKKERNERILLRKVRTAPEELCSGFPEMLEYYQACQRLQYSEQPPYSDLLNFFRDGLNRRDLQYDLVFDWIGATDSESGSSHAESEQHVSSRSKEHSVRSALKRKAGDGRSAPPEGSRQGAKQLKIEPA